MPKSYIAKGIVDTEESWNDEAALAFARATFGPEPGSPARRIDAFLDSVGELTVHELLAKLGLWGRLAKLCAPVADLTVNVVAGRLLDLIVIEAERGIGR